jgi:hypothetical protein
MRRVGLLVLVPFCLLAFTAVARATEFEITEKASGHALERGNGKVLLKLAFASPKECVFNQSEGNLESKNPNPEIEFRFPHLKEENCPEYKGTKTRFYKMIIKEKSSQIKLELESNSTKAKIMLGSCLYLLGELDGIVPVPGELHNIEVSGTGELKTETAGCEPTETFHAKFELLNENESMDPPFLISY